jgi:hypothetical protein
MSLRDSPPFSDEQIEMLDQQLAMRSRQYERDSRQSSTGITSEQCLYCRTKF